MRRFPRLPALALPLVVLALASPCAGAAETASALPGDAFLQPVSGPVAVAGHLLAADAAPVLFTAPDATAALGTVATPRGTLAELAGTPAARARRDSSYPARAPQSRAPEPQADAAPSPSGPGSGAALACGIAVLIFMARRKLAVPGG